MAASASSASPLSLCLLILLYAVASHADARSFPHIRDHQIKNLDNIFGEQIGFPLRDHSSGSDQSSFSGSLYRRSSSKTDRPEYGFQPSNILPRFLLDFMGHQRKFKGRTRKNSSCFRLKMDDTGVASRLGC
ncbi:C-type natriuretic peptide 2-like [Arapaima gigas]